MARRPGITTLMILASLVNRRAYGLDIIDRTGLGPGTVYTTLRRMEKRGLVQGGWEDPSIAERERRPRRRYYSLLPEGSKALAGAQTELRKALLERGHGLGGPGVRES